MRTILVLSLKDVRRRLAAPAGLLLNLAIPLVITGTMLLTFGRRGGGDEQQAPVLRLLAVVQDEGPMARMISGASQSPEFAKHIELRTVPDRESGLRRMRAEGFAALLVIPEDFSDVLLDGRRAELEMVKNPAQSVMPVVAQQGAEVLALYLSIAASLLGEEGPRVRALFEGEGWDDPAGLASLLVTLRDRVVGIDDYLIPPLVEVATARPEKQTAGFDWMAWMFPGMVVMVLLFGALVQMADVLRERQWGTLRRQFAAPLSATAILASKVLAAAAVVGLAVLLLIIAGAALFGIRWGNPGALAAVALLVVLGATGFAALIYSFVRTERQGDGLGGVLVMVMSLLGGAFLPPQILPEWLQQVSVFTISHWSHGALRALATGGGWAEVAPFLPALAGLAVSLSASGVFLLRRRHLRGAL
jgi:ABC-2 type transport system permease protein